MQDTPIQVLLVEDNPADARLIQVMLRNASADFAIQHAKRLSATLKCLCHKEIDVILLDLRLPDSRGLGTFESVHERAPRVPIVVLSGLDDEDLAIEAVRLGAQDYLIKGQVDRPLLVRALRYAVERKRIETALRASEEQYRRLVESSDALIFSVDREGVFHTAGGTRLRDYGLQPKDVVGHRLKDLFPQAQAAVYRQRCAEIFATGQPQTYEHSFEYAGLTKTDMTTLYPIEDEGGQVTWVGAICHDISGRKRAEEERERLLVAEREQRKLAETLMEVTHALNTSLDLEKVLHLILEQLALVVDYDSTSVMLLSDGALETVASRCIRPESQHLSRSETEGLSHVWHVIDRQHPALISDTRADSRWLDRPESRYIRCWLGVPLVSQGQVIGLLNLDKREPGYYNEQHLQVSVAFANQAATAIENARLYEQLQQRMEQLKQTQAQLIQSAKMAAIGQLAAGVAHELNNPLQSVVGFAELARRNDGLEARIKEDLDIITKESRRARDIVRHLLEFSRQSEPFKEPADLNQVVRDTLALLRQQLHSNGITVEERYAANLSPVRLDVGRMKQVFLNLFSNAAQAMAHGGVLTVRSEWQQDGVAVHVTDTGTGIPPEHLPRIFEPFFTTKPVGQGTGLSLSVSLGIVQDHGGRIDVRSDEGQGSTFCVWLPTNETSGKATVPGK